MLLASGEGSAQCVLQVVFRYAGRGEEMFAIDEFGEGRAGGDARRAAVDLVSDLFQGVVGNFHREACDVAAGLVTGFAASRGVRDLTGVSRPDEMVYYL